MKWKNCSQNNANLQIQLVNEKRFYKNKNFARYKSMHVQFNNIKNTCENYYKKIEQRSLKRKNLTLHQSITSDIKLRKSCQESNEKKSPSSFQIILKLWKEKRENQINLQKLTKKSKINLRKAESTHLRKKNVQKFDNDLIQIQKKRKIIFQQIESQMPKFPWEKK